MLHLKQWFVRLNQLIILLAFDLLALYLSLGVGIWAREAFFPWLLNIPTIDLYVRFYIFSLWWIPALYLVVFALEKLYTTQKPFWDEVKVLGKAVIITSVLIYSTVSLGKLTTEISRVVLVIQPIVAFPLLIIFRRVIKILTYHLGIRRLKALLLQVNGPETIKEDFQANPYIGYEIVDTISLPRIPDRLDGVIQKIRRRIDDFNIDTVIVGAAQIEDTRFAALTQKLYFTIPHILIVPKHLRIDVLHSEIYHLLFNNLFVLDIQKGLNKPSSLAIKRIIDVIISVFSLLLCSPLLLLVALLIKLQDGGSVFYTQDRFGKDGKTFRIFKFRTMIPDSEEILEQYLADNPKMKDYWEKYRKLPRDPRVTRIGRLLRATSLDEAPQLINILKGDMSFVGPRAFMPREKEDMGEYFREILAVKPGLTGLWQVSGRSELSFQKRLEMDVNYIQNWSYWLDMVITVKTVRILLQKVGAR